MLVEIRDAKITDAEEIFLVISGARISNYKYYIPVSCTARFLRENQPNNKNKERFKHRLADKLNNHKANVVKVFTVDGRIKGYCAAKLLADYAYISNLHIHPSSQGQGYGRALLAHMLSLVGKCEVRLHVLDQNTAAIAIYELYHFRLKDLSTRAFYGAERKLMVRPVVGNERIV